LAETFEVKITKQAQEQMIEIFDYISNELCSPDTAKNLLEKLENDIEALAGFPKKYPLVDEEPWRTKGIRKAGVNNFPIIVRLN